MAENEKTQSVSVEEFNKVKSDFENLSKQNAELLSQFKDVSDKHAKLEKIFDERQTKSKEQILKALGLEKAPEKTELEVITGKFNELSETVKALQADNEKKTQAIALNEKKAKVIELAKQYNFVDVSDVLSVIDYANDDFEGQVKQIAETKKHWIGANANLGKSFTGASNPTKASLEAQLRDAYNNGDVMTAISLKRQIAERN